VTIYGDKLKYWGVRHWFGQVTNVEKDEGIILLRIVTAVEENFFF
jgi:hypothetical protein